MKRTLKRILPILLAIVVICSIIWYLFVYDREFTRDVLLHQARFFESQGNHNIAAWLYNQAYLQSEDNESVAIELAEQFKAIGNYTKAETTLSSAIADGGSAELYIALCKTYVEQDKLLDAVTMLDNISNPEIKEQLDQKRPKTPEVNYEPGFYSQYITVSISCSGGTLYTTTDGAYPSIEDTPGTGEITLVGGENTIFALVVGDDGLVSPLAIYGYTVGGVIEEITLEDSTMDSLIRQHLELDSSATLYSNDLWGITSLVIPEGADSYSDLSYLPYLETLRIHGSTAGSLEGLQNLSHLTQLTLSDCLVTSQDLQIIASLPNLTKLSLSGCNLSSIEQLSSASKLTELDLSNNAIRDLSALSFMTSLQNLNLSHNALTSLNAISSLTALEILDISYNSLPSVTPLSSCTALKELYINNNTIADLDGIENLTALTVLSAAFNELTDVTPLGGLTALETLDISNNQLTDISALSTLNKLQFFNFSRNQVTTLPSWSSDSVLVSIDGSYNQIETISGLAGFGKLNHVLMDYNQITAVNALASCHNLIKVSVYGNPVSDVSALTAMDVIVNYNPLN